MRTTKDIKIDEKEIHLRELTVHDIRGLLDHMEAARVEEGLLILDLLFPDRMPAAAVAISMGITEKALAKRKFAPSDYERILDAAESINPTFAGLLARLAEVGRAAAPLKPSTGAAAG